MSQEESTLPVPTGGRPWSPRRGLNSDMSPCVGPTPALFTVKSAVTATPTGGNIPTCKQRSVFSRQGWVTTPTSQWADCRSARDVKAHAGGKNSHLESFSQITSHYRLLKVKNSNYVFP